MSYYNPFNLPVEERVEETRSFRHPRVKNAVLELTLRALDLPESLESQDLAESKIRMYITGTDGKGKDTYGFPAVGGRAVKITPSLCRAFAAVYIMQVPQIDEETEEWYRKYSFEELVAWAVTLGTRVWGDVMTWVNEIGEKEEEREQSPNAPGAPGE